MSTPSNQDNIPGFVQGALVNLLTYDSRLLSEYGENLAIKFYKEIIKHRQELKAEALKIDALWEE